MAQINLLTPAIGKKIKKTETTKSTKTSRDSAAANPIPKILFPPGLIVCIMLCLWLIMGQRVSAANKKLNALIDREQVFSVDPQELVKLNDVKENLEERLSFVESLLVRKFFWSEKLEEISKVIPFGVWLTNISLQKKRIASHGATDKSEGRKKVLSITGKAVAPQIENAVDLIGQFNVSLKKNELFAKDFSDIELKSVSKSTIAKTDMMSFEFLCILK